MIDIALLIFTLGFFASIIGAIMSDDGDVYKDSALFFGFMALLTMIIAK